MVSGILQVHELKKSYGHIKALNGVTFEVDGGEIVGYLGPNGAGKTTTLKIIAGILKPDEGDVFIQGISVREDPIGTKKLISYVPETGGLFNHLTVYEHIQLVASLRKLSDEEVRKGMELLERFGLIDRLRQRISTLSRGNRQRLLLAGAFMIDAPVYLLDEPLVGLDATTAIEVKKMLRELADKGKTILFSSHILETVERVCDRVVVIENGRIVAQGDMESIKKMGTLEEFFAKLVSADRGEPI